MDFRQVKGIGINEGVVKRVLDSKGVVLWEQGGEDPANSYFYVEDVSGQSNTLTIKRAGNTANTYPQIIEVFKSTDGSTWQSMGSTSTTGITATIPANGRLYLKATPTKTGWGTYSSSYYTYIYASGNHNVGGNIKSLIYGDDFKQNTNNFPYSNSTYCFNKLFYYDSTLISAKNLCVGNMSTVGCFEDFFRGCSSLTEATITCRDIRGNSNGAFKNMFSGVSTTGNLYMHYDFNIESMPANWKRNLVKTSNKSDYFYVERFYADTTTPSISIIKTSNVAPTITVYKSTDGENWELIGDTSTKAITAAIPTNGRLYLKANTTSWSGLDSNTYVWHKITASYAVYGGNIMSLLYGDDFKDKTEFPVNSQGNFFGLFRETDSSVANGCYDVHNLIFPPSVGFDSYRQMFYGCQFTEAPELPATTLANGCYRQMFYGCAKLTTAPALPATTLIARCYQNMFYNCTKLNNVTTYAKDISATSCIDNWLYGVAAAGDFYNLGTATYSSGTSGIPTGWTEHKSL